MKTWTFECVYGESANVFKQSKTLTMAPGGNLVLPDLLPTLGFEFDGDRGAPMILRSRARDKAVVDALSNLFRCKLRKRLVAPALAEVFLYLAEFIDDGGFAAIKKGEGKEKDEDNWSVYFLFSFFLLCIFDSIPPCRYSQSGSGDL